MEQSTFLRSFRYLVTVRLWRGLIARSDYCLVQTSRTGIIIREKEQKTGAGGKQDQRRSKTKAWNRKEREEQAAGRISSIYVQEPSTEDSKIRNQGTDNESNQEQATNRESWIVTVTFLPDVHGFPLTCSLLFMRTSSSAVRSYIKGSHGYRRSHHLTGSLLRLARILVSGLTDI